MPSTRLRRTQGETPCPLLVQFAARPAADRPACTPTEGRVTRSAECPTRVAGHAVVTYEENEPVGGCLAKLHANHACAAFWKGVFARIGDELVQDQPAGDRPVDGQIQVLDFDVQGNRAARRARGVKHVLSQASHVLRKGYPREIPGLI